MSGYEQRARDYLDRFTEEPTWDVYSPDAQAALEAIFESIAAEARGQERAEFARLLNERIAAACLAFGEESDVVRCLTDALARIRALAPRPDVRLVAREDLVTVIEAAAELEQRIRAERAGYDVSRADEIRTAIDRLRAGEEG